MYFLRNVLCYQIRPSFQIRQKNKAVKDSSLFGLGLRKDNSETVPDRQFGLILNHEFPWKVIGFAVYEHGYFHWMIRAWQPDAGYNPADLTVSKRPGTSFRIEIHFAVFSRLYLLFSFIKLVETW